MREVLSLLLTILLASPVMPAAGKDSLEQTKKKVLSMSAGSSVEVRLTDRTSLRGRLGAVNDNDFTVDVLKDGKIQPAQVRFQDVKSVKKANASENMSAGAKAGWAILLVGIVLAAIIGISCAAGANCASN